MKEIMDPLPAGQSADKESFANRKLIRPTLPRTENNNHGNHNGHAPVPVAMPRERVERHDRMERSHDRSNDRNNHDRLGSDRVITNERISNERGSNDRISNDHISNDRGSRFGGSGGGGRKPSPPEQTNAENFYYQKQMQSRTPMVIVLRDGEEVHGIIEWYDRDCIKVNREGGEANLMIYKPAIKYMYKEGEGS
jgi:host factor-I protein